MQNRTARWLGGQQAVTSRLADLVTDWWPRRGGRHISNTLSGFCRVGHQSVTSRLADLAQAASRLVTAKVTALPEFFGDWGERRDCFEPYVYGMVGSDGFGVLRRKISSRIQVREKFHSERFHWWRWGYQGDRLPRTFTENLANRSDGFWDFEIFPGNWSIGVP